MLGRGRACGAASARGVGAVDGLASPRMTTVELPPTPSWCGSVAVAVAGQRLHDLPAALPVPGDRPAARAAEPGARPAARWSTPCSSGCSTCRRPSRTLERPRDLVAPEWERLLEEEPELAELFDEDEADDELAPGSAADAARALLRARGPDPARAGRARAVRDDDAGVRAAPARLRRPPRRRARRATCGSSTTRPAARPARGSRPRRCSR